MNDNVLVCACCAGEIRPGREYSLDNDVLCEECYDNETAVCDRCGGREYQEDVVYDGDLVLCTTCYDDYYDRCACCNHIFETCDMHMSDSDDWFCDSCWDSSDTRPIHDYGYKPYPEFYGEGPLYLGVELEIDNGNGSTSDALEILEKVNKDSTLIYIKHDGSLSSGMEIVSHPMSLDYHRNSMPWKILMHTAFKLGYRSHDAGTCGLHVHVSRAALGDSFRDQEDVISRILFFVEQHWNELFTFSRRTYYQIQEWADRYGYQSEPSAILNAAKGGGDRHTCVNICNGSTIEFRIFRGTLKYNTFIATLELVSEIVRVAKELSDSRLGRQSWSAFVSTIDTDAYPELIKYLKEKRLYINSPIPYEEGESA